MTSIVATFQPLLFICVRLSPSTFSDMLIRLFQRALKTRPVLTQIVVSGAICGGGDAFTQVVIEKRHMKDFDYTRSSRFFVLASAFIAPCLIKWFKFLERVRGDPKVVPLIRVACDQLLFAPEFNAAILFNLRVLEGFDFKTSWRMMKEDWWTIYLNSLKVWPAAQLINFYLIPLNMRVIVVQMVAFFWNAYLSYATHH